MQKQNNDSNVSQSTFETNTLKVLMLLLLVTFYCLERWINLQHASVVMHKT